MTAKLRVARLDPYALRAAEPPVSQSEAELQRRARLLTMEEAAVYLRYADAPADAQAANSAYCWLRKHKVHFCKRGTRVLVRVSAIDDLLETGATDFVARARAGGRR